MENYFSNNINIKINFYYFVFPKLLNDGLFYNKKKKEDDASNLWTKTRTNFTSKNSDCLYNQFEKEGNNIIIDENIIKNYYNYYYTLTPIKSYHKPYEYHIKILFLQYFSKFFYQIPLSKKNYYFDYIMLFMNINQDIIDDNTIMMIFNSIIKYGDSNMALNFFHYIRRKTYTNFLILREKTRKDKNFVKFLHLDKNNNFEEMDEFADNYFNDHNDKVERSLSGYNLSNIRLGSMPTLRGSNYSSISRGEKKLENSKLDLKDLENKEYEFEVNNNFDFTLNFYCNSCNSTNDLNTNHVFDEGKKYMEFKCSKCGKLQELTITCEFNEENKESKQNNNNKNNLVNIKLYSPLALLEIDWFKNSLELNLYNVIEKHLDEYFSAIFYFYEQGLLCDFLMQEISSKKALTKESNMNFGNNMENNAIKNKKDIHINNSVEIPLSSRKGSIFDISDTKQNFFELKSNTKNIPSLKNSSIKKKNSSKKKVGFSSKNKNVIPNKNNISYSEFLKK